MRSAFPWRLPSIPRLLTGLLLCCMALGGTVRARQITHAFIIVIDGARFSETFGDSTHQYIPRIWNHLRTAGTIFTSFYNDGLTITNPGHASIATGTWQFLANDGSERPHEPTIFEYLRKKTKRPPTDAYVVSGKDKLRILTYSTSPDYGSPYGASVRIPEDRHDDQGTFDDVRSVMRTVHPLLLLANFPSTDKSAHDSGWISYTGSLRRADSLANEVWNLIQADSIYRNTTTLFITNDHGRHLDGIADGYKSHGDSCAGCRHIMLVAVGPGIPAGAVDTTRRTQIDIAPTIGRMLGFPTPASRGKAIPFGKSNGD